MLASKSYNHFIIFMISTNYKYNIIKITKGLRVYFLGWNTNENKNYKWWLSFKKSI